MSAQAIHLELVLNMSDQFLQSLINFSCHRGVSNWGKNFVFTQPLLGERVELKSPMLEEYLEQNDIM